MHPEDSPANRASSALRAAVFRAAALLIALPAVLAAQDAPEPAVPGAELTVWLVTMDYGDAIWQNFGHNAIRVHDARTGDDVAYNYGMFDFDEPGFLTRFLRGEMRYWMAAFDFEPMVRFYAQENRTVVVERLNLTPAERLELQQFLQWNALPENRHYRYDYYRDNCSTRVRDAIDRVLDGAVRASLEPIATGRTYRSESLRLTSANLPIYTGMDLGLGPYSDRVLDAWEESFIPMRLREHLHAVTVPGPDGARVPLIAEAQVIYLATREPPPEQPPARFFGFLLAGLFGAGLVALLGRAADRRHGLVVLLGVVVFVWALVTGLLGLILTGLWALTGHVSAYRNENLFQANPLALGLAVAGPAALVSGRMRDAARTLGLLLAGLSLVGLLLWILPFFDQSTGRIAALLMPIHLAVAWVLARSPRRTGAVSSRGYGGERAWRAREARAQGRHR